LERQEERSKRGSGSWMLEPMTIEYLLTICMTIEYLLTICENLSFRILL